MNTADLIKVTLLTCSDKLSYQPSNVSLFWVHVGFCYVHIKLLQTHRVMLHFHCTPKSRAGTGKAYQSQTCYSPPPGCFQQDYEKNIYKNYYVEFDIMLLLFKSRVMKLVHYNEKRSDTSCITVHIYCWWRIYAGLRTYYTCLFAVFYHSVI